MEAISRIAGAKDELLQTLTRSTELTQQTGTKTHRDRLRRQLILLAEARKETMSAEALLLYSKAIEREFSDGKYVDLVLARLMESPRGEYEEKIPALGELLQMIRDERKRANQIGPCEACNGSRFVPAEENGVRLARRCRCWIDWKAKQQAVTGIYERTDK